MKKEVSVKQKKNAFVSGETGVKIELFLPARGKHKFLLTKKEAKELLDGLQVALWGLYAPKD